MAAATWRPDEVDCSESCDNLMIESQSMVDHEQKLSSFTADDPLSLLDVAGGKIKELEGQVELHKQELERLQELCLDLVESDSAAGADQQFLPSSSCTAPTAILLQQLVETQSAHSGSPGDFDEIACCRLEIQRLSGLVQKLQDERGGHGPLPFFVDVDLNEKQAQKEVGSLEDDDDDDDRHHHQTALLWTKSPRLQEVDQSRPQLMDREGDWPAPSDKEHHPRTGDDDYVHRGDVQDVRAEDQSEVAFWKAKCDQLSTALQAEKNLAHHQAVDLQVMAPADDDKLDKGTVELKVIETTKMESTENSTSKEAALESDAKVLSSDNPAAAESQLKSEIHRLLDQVAALQRDKATLKEELDQMRIDRELDNRTDDKKELETLQRRLQVLEDQVTALGAEKESLVVSLEELDAQHQMAIGQLLSSREELQKRCNDLQSPERSLDNLLNQLQHHPEVFRRGNSATIKKLELVRDSLAALVESKSSESLDELREALRQKDAILETRFVQQVAEREELLDRVQELEKLNAELATARVETFGHQGRSEDDDDDLQQLKEKVSELEAFLVDRERQISALNDILRVYKDNLDPDQEAERHKHASAIEELRAQVKTLEAERGDVTSLLHDKTKEIDNLKVEVHRLINESSNAEASREDMTKEAMRNLARLVRDRELEIEALKQKNETLVSLLTAESSGRDGDGTDNKKLLAEREELKTAVERHQREREQIVDALNQKHAESLAYHAEIQRMAVVIDQLRSGSQELIRQYELVQKQLLDAQQQLVDSHVTPLKTKVQPQNDVEEMASSGHDPVHEPPLQQQQEPQVEVERLVRNLQDKDKLLFEKDRQLHEKMRQVQSVGEQMRRKEQEVTAARQQCDKLSEQLEGCRRGMEALRATNGSLRARMEELRSAEATLKEANSMLSVTLQEREFELKALREKEDTLSRMVMKNEADDDQDIRRLLSESEQMRQSAQGFRAERDQAILALGHKQREADELRDQIKGACKEREERLLRELDRLRDHLLHVEESYTQEALRAEDREKELRTRLAHAEDRVHSASSSHSSATHQATLQAESLQEQLRSVVDQRDQVLLSLSTVEDQLAQKATALHTLQVVLEQLQQERQRDLTALQARHEANMTVERSKSEHLQQEIRSLIERQRETTEALGAASRLTEQLDRKEEIIQLLRQEVKIRDAEIEKAKQEIVRINSSSEVTVDRTIVKNLVVGLLTVPAGQHKEVLRVIATILDFNKEERERTGLDQEGHRSKSKQTSGTSATKTGGWMSVSGWRRMLSNEQHQPPATGGGQQSLGEAFVRFLERESQPAAGRQQPMVNSRPTTAGSSGLDPTHKGASGHANRVPRANPFNYPMVNHHSTLGLMGADNSPLGASASMGSSHLLLKPMSTALPTFAPSVSVLAASDNAAFLRDALQHQ